MKNIAIKINNPSRIAAMFGECAGDYQQKDCQFWVGTENSLVPRETPEGAEIIKEEVQFCGGSAWLKKVRDARVAKEEADQEADQEARRREKRIEYIGFAERRLEALKKFPRQEILENMGYSSEEIREATEKRIEELEKELVELK